MSRAVAQFGSASGWGSEGRRFNSCQPDSFPLIISRQNVRGFVVFGGGRRCMLQPHHTSGDARA